MTAPGRPVHAQESREAIRDQLSVAQEPTTESRRLHAHAAQLRTGARMLRAQSYMIKPTNALTPNGASTPKGDLVLESPGGCGPLDQQ